MSSYPPPPAYQPQPSEPAGEPPIWAPYYGISFIPAIRRALSKYADFSGRASRSEFWWALLAYFIVYVVLYVISLAVGGGSGMGSNAGSIIVSVILILFLLAVIVPTLALYWRRLHDVNLAGPFWFLSFIPFVGGIIVLIMVILPSNPQGQRFDRPRG